MDPNANLREQREIATRIQADEDAGREPNAEDASRLAELVLALHGWLSKGGALPQPWERS